MTDKDQGSTDPMKGKNDVREANDPKIDQDFEGFPNNLARPDIIDPTNETDKKTAGLNREPMSEYEDDKTKDKRAINELESDGSGGAFSQTEEVDDDEGHVREDPEKDEPHY